MSVTLTKERLLSKYKLMGKIKDLYSLSYPIKALITIKQ